MNTPTVSSLAAVVALELPKIPPLSEDPSVIVVADFIRVGMLMLGLSIAAVSVRQMMTVQHQADADREAHRGGVQYTSVLGFRWRVSALVIAILYVCFSAYDRLGDPVSLQFVLALMFLLVALRSVQIAAYLPRSPVPSEQRLRETLTQFEREKGTGPP